MFDYFQHTNQLTKVVKNTIPEILHDHVVSARNGLQEKWYQDGKLVAIISFVGSLHLLDTISYYDQAGKLNNITELCY